MVTDGLHVHVYLSGKIACLMLTLVDQSCPFVRHLRQPLMRVNSVVTLSVSDEA